MVLEMTLKVRMMLVDMLMSVGWGSVGLVRFVGFVVCVAFRMFWVGLSFLGL